MLLAAPSAARPAQRFDSPFAPAQCGRAVAAGRRAVAGQAASTRARLLLAEGYLCLGLQGDAWALESAIDSLRAVLAAEPRHFFAQLELADALRLRYPRSAAAATALQRARTLLEHVDVGAARTRLRAYVDEAIAATGELAAQGACPPQGALAELDSPELAPDRLGEVADRFLACGREAAAALDAALARRGLDRPGAAAVLLFRAEARRGVAAVGTVRRLYQAAALRACAARPHADWRRAETGGVDEATCARARMRLAELQHVRPAAAP
jgi:hypothetical protein